MRGVVRILLTSILIVSAFVLFAQALYAVVRVTAIVPGVCGNGIAEVLEQCDETDLAGMSCSLLGYQSGTLGCSPVCSYDVTNCVSTPITPPSGGGGGGGGGGSGGGQGQVIFRGTSYPGSDVTLMRDAKVIGTGRARRDGTFDITVSNNPAGSYNFGVWAEDAKGLHSATYNFTISVTSGSSMLISGIFLPPTIGTDMAEIRQGNIVTVYGYSQPRSEVTITVNSLKEIIETVRSDLEGSWMYRLDTSQLEKGEHHIRARTKQDEELSTFSKSLTLIVGDRDVEAKLPEKTCSNIADVNNDCKVNLVDYSILAYWYKRPNPPIKLDLNKDKKVDLIDFSIMAYHWTG